MKDKKPTTKRELLLFLLDSVNYEDEYNWVKAQLDALDAAECEQQGGENMERETIHTVPHAVGFLRDHLDMVVCRSVSDWHVLTEEGFELSFDSDEELIAFALAGVVPLVRYTGALLWPPLAAMVIAVWRRDGTDRAPRPSPLPTIAWGTGFFLLPLALWVIRNWLVLGSPLQTEYLSVARELNQSTLEYYLRQALFCFGQFPYKDLVTPSIPKWFTTFRVGTAGLYWAAVVVGAAVAWRRRRFDLLSLALWVVLLHLFHIVWPFREERFFMPAFPAVCILGCYGAGALIRGRAARREFAPEASISAETQATPNRRGGARETRLYFLLTGLVVAFLIALSPVLYAMQYYGLGWQSGVAQAQVAGRMIRRVGSPHDRVATWLDAAEMYYYARRPVERFRTPAELQAIVDGFANGPTYRPDQRLWIVFPDYNIPKDVAAALDRLHALPQYESSQLLKTDRPRSVYVVSLRM